MIVCPNCREENPPKFRLCGYCGTHFRYKAALGPGRADPAACLWDRRGAAA